MDSKSNIDKSYWKQIGLVVLGGVLASIPALLTTYISMKGERDRLILEKRITCLRDLTSSCEKIRLKHLPLLNASIKKCEDTIAACRNHSCAKKDIKNIQENNIEILAQLNSFIAEYNTNIISASILFGKEYKLLTFEGEKNTIKQKTVDSKKTAPRVNYVPITELEDVRASLIETRKTETKMLNKALKHIESLTAMSIMK